MTQTVKVQNSNQIFVDNDISQLLLGNNRFIKGDVTASGADVEIVEGLVVSRVGATGKLKPFVATVVDGTEYIVGVAIRTISVLDGTTVSVDLVNGGRIPESKINFLGAETLATLAGVTGSQRMVKDILEDLGLDLLGGVELTEVDNS